MESSSAMTGIQTVRAPASKLPIPVMHVMEAMMATVLLVETLDPSSSTNTGSSTCPEPWLVRGAGSVGEALGIDVTSRVVPVVGTSVTVWDIFPAF